MRAHLRFYQKLNLGKRYVVELSIFEIDKPTSYPNGVKYGLICKDLKSGKYVLMDNHHPKGPHVHINEQEFEYKYTSDLDLIKDFKKLVFKELGVRL